ncbi:bifunctional folylpolyglutamate synthase/dihydrofolate synthase [Miniphocaeibacter halophilus]|uniref:Bifunctional folylpolyglutamate synthase/dihydrofolate synthase n=1 Tax=Miniphocaeibacter halophilus TaxID=2931922 RepID=A0AC61MQY6_9FIRM|nr:Mur ligase family protein [Miniphocaeibacter halophilus]QQK07907.1 bifunctional folylpolyglutamate synthase/dihydrofolate synthase [Miniphocaeibacter halophilus]
MNRNENQLLNIAKDIKTFNGKENVKPILEYFGNPQDKLKVIHVAGTNGKGSVSAFINNILIENKYNIGLFTSPAIFEPNDRIKINNENISDYDLLAYYNKVIRVSEKLNIKLHEFDIATIIAYLYFYNKNCDLAIIEVGIGGRIDSTNIVKKPLISVICKIGRDHLEILGNNIEEIAREKAGIIKKDSAVAIYNQEENILNIVENIGKDCNNEIIIPDFNEIKNLNINLNKILFFYKDYEIEIQMTNIVQVYNAVLALEVVLYLGRIGYSISKNNILRGILKTRVMGRFQILNENPMVILDGAHNVESVKALNKTLKEDFPNEKFVFITSFFKDKEYMKLVEIMAPLAYAFIACETDDKRTVESLELTNFLGMFCDRVHNGKTIKNSLDIAMNNFSDKKIIIYGSLSLIKDSVDYFN